MKTIRCWISHLRKFTLAGKPDEIPDGKRWEEILAEAGIQLPMLSQVRKVPKTFTSVGVDPVAKAKVSVPRSAPSSNLELSRRAVGARAPPRPQLGIERHLRDRQARTRSRRQRLRRQELQGFPAGLLRQRHEHLP